jgi:hypothetical protein
MRNWPWQRIFGWIFALTIVWQLMAINENLEKLHRYVSSIEGNTAHLNGTLNVNVENEPLTVQTQ